MRAIEKTPRFKWKNPFKLEGKAKEERERDGGKGVRERERVE